MARCGVFVSKELCLCTRLDKVAARAVVGCTVAHKVEHSSGLKRSERKIEVSGPAPNVVELENTVNTAL